MRLSEVVFHLQEMLAASRAYMDTTPVEEGTAHIMVQQNFALEMAIEKLSGMLPKQERDALADKRKAN